MKWLLVLVPSLAFAGPSKKDVEWSLTNRGDDADTAVKFGFDSKGVNGGAKTWADADHDRVDLIELRDPTIVTATDGKSAWAAVNARRGSQCAGLTGTIDKCKDFEEPAVNVIVLYDKADKKWNPIAVHSAIPTTKAATALAAVPDAIDASAADAVKVFKDGLADPKSLSARKDIVMFGSAPKEKFVGAKVGAALAKWKLAFTVKDGISAGTTASKTVAWVAANVDAKPTGKEGPVTAYRVMALYEQDKAKAWKLVALEFSIPAP